MNEIASHYPSIIALSPNETNIFVVWGFLQKDPEVEMIGFDLTKKQIMTQSKTLFSGAKIFLMVPGTNNIITNSLNQFQIIQLFKDYPNTINFCLTNNSRPSYEFPSGKLFIERSEDSKFLFTSSEEGIFESYTFTSPPQLLASLNPFNNTKPFETLPFKIRMNLAIFQVSNGFHFVDISDPTNITPGVRHSGGDSSWGIRAYALSPQENFLVFWTRNNNAPESRVKVVDFSNLPSSITEIPLFNYTTKSYIQLASLSNKGRIIYFVHENFTIYNISDFNSPKLMFSKPLAPFDPNVIISSMTLSPDDKTLFILTLKSNMEKDFVVIDVSDLTSPKVLSNLDVPKAFQDANPRPFLLSRDMKMGFLTTDKDILIMNFQNLSSPVVIGMISYSSLGIEGDEIEFSNFFLSPDEKIGYLPDFYGKFFQVNLDIPYTLYLPQEKFLLGKKSSENLLFLQSDLENDFLPMSSSADYKTIKLLLFDLNVVSSKASPVTSNSSLPSWITFDYENQALTVESKKQRELGSYILYSFTSKKIPRQVFGSNLSGGITSEDMVTLLISLGYLDNQRFLTSGFGSYEDFLLPSQYAESQETIYKTLQSYRIETFTDFSVIPSLTLSTDGGKLSLKTPSDYSIKVGIKLHNKEAKFLQKTYSTLQPVITDQKSRLTIEGPLELVNEALKDLVVNLNNNITSSCTGEITINDQLNPPISQFFNNISEYFFKNEAPKLNTSHPFTLQQQIDLNTLYTGQSFSISIDPQTFMDSHSEALSYELIREGNQESKKNLPSWITYQGGLTIKGIPPEDWMNREIHLVLIVKNEFKQIEVPLALNIHISMIFAAKLVMRYSPYLLTALGLLVSANKIINIFCKKRYRHLKDVSVRVGEEITSSIIFPMRFIAEEKAEGELILRNLLFSEKFDEEKVRKAIQDIVNGLDPKVKQKFKLYFQEGSGQKRVEQYVLNQVTMQQLNSTEEKSTRDLFDKIKGDWAEFIEFDEDFSCFKINETRLDALLAQTQERKDHQDLTDHLLSSTNLDLLKKALVVYVTKHHEIEDLEWKVAVELKMKIQRNPLFTFLKLDLQKIPNGEKSQKAYGIDYHIQEDHLIVSGTPHANFEGRTVVLQGLSERQRILKELWIHGVSSSAKIDVRHRMSSFDKSYDAL